MTNRFWPLSQILCFEKIEKYLKKDFYLDILLMQKKPDLVRNIRLILKPMTSQTG